MDTVRLDSPYEARLTVRPLEDRMGRVRASYTFWWDRSGLRDTWRDYVAFEHGAQKHTLVTLSTPRGWRAVSCTCEAFQHFDEICVHCKGLDEWLEREKETIMSQNNTALAVVNSADLLKPENRDEAKLYEIVNQTYFKGQGTPSLLALVATICERNQLDLFNKHLWVVPRRSNVNGQWVETWDIMVSIHGYLAIADRTGQFEGITDELWCGKDGDWKDVWLSSDYPAAARVTVHATGKKPYVATATWDQYAQTKPVYEGSGNNRRATGAVEVTEMWKKYPADQLGKCALMKGLRKLFPNNGTFRSDSIGEGTYDGQGREVITGDGYMVDTETGEVLDKPGNNAKNRTHPAEDVHDAEFEDAPADDAAAKRLGLRTALLELITPHPERLAIRAWMINEYGNANLTQETEALEMLHKALTTDTPTKPWDAPKATATADPKGAKADDQPAALSPEVIEANERAEAKRLAAEQEALAKLAPVEDPDDPFAGK